MNLEIRHAGESSHPAPLRTAITRYPERGSLTKMNGDPMGTDSIDDYSVSAAERIITVVQRLVDERSIARAISTNDTLLEVGLTSLDAVRLVLLVEDEFAVEIPVSELTLANFRSILTISRLVTKLLNQS
ncbi:MAG TPA: phosphopantetheine-binding protein [Candidatus Binataceae bacterium]|nr:phosphopantetheine-binding protein [Candidatus Binataceae bacterium]